MGGEQIRFGQFQLDLGRRELSRDGALIRVGSRALDILAVLARAKGDVVTKDELMARVWPGLIVEENNIQVHVSALRKALDDGANGQIFLLTVPGRGYRLVGLQEDRALSNKIAKPLVSPDKPSLAVLPFCSIGGEANLDDFADGLTEDIITGLSRLQFLWVIARNTVFTFKGRATDARTAARDLGVRYVVEGSVRQAGNQLRLTAQLIDAETGRHIWAEKIDRSSTDLLALQDDLTASVVASIQTQLTLFEGKASAASEESGQSASRLLARSWQRVYEFTDKGLAATKLLAERALQMDPANGAAARLVATAVWHQAYLGYIPLDENATRQVNEYAKRAIQALDCDEHAYWAMGCGHLFAREHDQAIASLHRALQINPNFSLASGTLGTVCAWAGKIEESISNNEIALRINPRDPSIFFRHFGLALAHFLSGRYAVALNHASEVMQLRSNWFLGQLIYAANLAMLGRSADAMRTIGELTQTITKPTISSLAALPFARASDGEHLADALRKAGLPEQ